MKHVNIFLLCLSALVLCATGCLEETGTGTLRITMQTGVKTISPAASADKISKYNLSGTGPGNKTISEISPSKTITIEGLPNGKWTLEASGLSEHGDVIASGSKTFSFKGASASETIYLENTVGTGSLSLDLKWDSYVTNPVFEFEIESTDGNIIRKTLEAGSGETSYNQSFDDLKSGFYTIKVLLFNSTIPCGGCCEAFSIANNTTTSGTVSFKPDFDNSKTKGLALSKTSSGTINAEINCSDNQSYTVDEKYSISLELLQSLNTADDIVLMWYEDGELVAQKSLSHTVNNFEFKAEKGMHIINAILVNKTASSTAGARFQYTGFNGDPEGTAIHEGTVKTNTDIKINLDSSTMIGVLPENKILILTPGKNTLQLCHISGSGMLLEQNGTYSTTMENFSCIKDATMLTSSVESEYFLIADSKNTVTLFRYNTKKNIIEPARRASDDSLVKYTKTFKSYASDFVQINKACIVKNSDDTSTVLFTDPNTFEIFSVVCTDKGIKSENITFKPVQKINCQAFAAYRNSIVYLSGQELFQSIFDGRTATSSWLSSTLSNAEIPYKILYINSQNILVACKNKIKRVLITGTTGNYDILSDVKINVNDFCLTPDGSYMFACSSDKKLYSYATDYVGNFKQLDVYTLTEGLKQVVANDVNIVAVTNSGNLEIFEISKEIL